jgi:hypothetical protein
MPQGQIHRGKRIQDNHGHRDIHGRRQVLFRNFREQGATDKNRSVQAVDRQPGVSLFG